MDFKRAVAIVLTFEGGLTDHPSDPGGLTNFGISLRAYPDLGRDGILKMTAKKAATIYKRDYWEKVQCDAFPPSLRLPLFDSAVNQGTKTAIKLMQTALGITSDGDLGPITLKAVAEADEDDLLINFLAERARHYGSLSTFKTFGRGWMRRLFHVTKMTMEDDRPAVTATAV